MPSIHFFLLFEGGVTAKTTVTARGTIEDPLCVSGVTDAVVATIHPIARTTEHMCVESELKVHTALGLRGISWSANKVWKTGHAPSTTVSRGTVGS